MTMLAKPSFVEELDAQILVFKTRELFKFKAARVATHTLGSRLNVKCKGP